MVVLKTIKDLDRIYFAYRYLNNSDDFDEINDNFDYFPYCYGK